MIIQEKFTWEKRGEHSYAFLMKDNLVWWYEEKDQERG
jgi:hypothetical protein